MTFFSILVAASAAPLSRLTFECSIRSGETLSVPSSHRTPPSRPIISRVSRHAPRAHSGHLRPLTSHLTTWRKAAHSGSLKALSKKRGRKPERNPLDEKVRKLERRNARLENELRKAHLIIDVQGKVAGLLGISLDDGTNS